MPPTGGGARVTRSSGAHTSADVDPRLRTPPSSPRRGGTDQSPGAAPGSRSHHGSPASGAASPHGDLSSPGPPSARLRVRRAKATSVVDALRKKKLPLPGQHCWWCWHAQPDHHPDDCCERQRPNMVDFKQARVPSRPRRRITAHTRTSSSRWGRSSWWRSKAGTMAHWRGASSDGRRQQRARARSSMARRRATRVATRQTRWTPTEAVQCQW